ncbi:hypothetical protein Leryth_025246 [Lithospermum erythrorhizon]|uniref:Uncharacterized protein n=1 Tax=Lithospermum erythrorhizon TaxID=34254 RepID=A0AAV3QGD5_LITER|nr:hypothetical protein Leryth_025246 [Lithospermum erythrorhizon]
MAWLEKMVFPVKKLWTTASSRVKSRKNGGGLLKLRDDIQTCGYQDVQIMWEMLSRTESESIPRRLAKQQRPFWRIFVWSNHSTSSSFSTNHAQ